MPIYGKFCGGFFDFVWVGKCNDPCKSSPRKFAFFFSTAEGLEDEFSAKKPSVCRRDEGSFSRCLQGKIFPLFTLR